MQLQNAITKRIDNIKNADLITLMMGTDDYGCDIPLGSEEDSLETSFYDSLDICFRKLKKNNSDVKFTSSPPYLGVVRTI